MTIPNAVVPYNYYVRPTVVSGTNSRVSVVTTTTSIANATSANATITAAKSYALFSITVSAGAWVSLYTTSALRTADSTRLITVDPTPGSGVIAEAITTSSSTTYFTPAVVGFNSDATPTSNVYLKIYNNSGASAAITVTVTYLPLE